jgi:hypothetical protein
MSMSTSTRTQFAEVVRQDPVDLGLACLLIESEANHETNVVEALATLDDLAAPIPVDGPDAERLRPVLSIFGGTTTAAEHSTAACSPPSSAAASGIRCCSR